MGLSVKIPGSCGELVQGMIDDIPFLVTCPISMYTKASITKYFSYLPYKARLARNKTLDYLGTKLNGYYRKMKYQRLQQALSQLMVFFVKALSDIII